jgi:hypothetical protein
MTQRAVALVYRPGEPASTTLNAVGRREVAAPAGARRRNRRLGRGQPYLVIILGVVLAVWLVVVFGRALTELNEASDRAAMVQAETALLQERLQAARGEASIVQGDAFMAMQARQYGMGRPGERAFALAEGAPPAPPVVPLGGDAGRAGGASPLESWLRLLLGRD